MLNRTSAAFTLLLSGLVALPPLSTDLGLPAFAATAAALHTTEPTVALTLSWFMLGFGGGPLIYGPMSERFGRRPVLAVGLVLYVATSVLCTVSPSIGVLLASRLIQGLAAASGTVLAIAVIRDLFEGLVARKKISYVMAINAVMPLTAPSIGVLVLAVGGWRFCYALMAAFGVLLLVAVLLGLGESIARKNPDSLVPRHLVRGYREVLTHPVSLRAALLNAMCFGVMFAYISGSPILFINLMHLPDWLFGLIFAVPVAGTAGGTLLNTVLLGRGVRPIRIVHAGLGLMTAAISGFAALSLGPLDRAAPVVALLAATNVGIGLVGPNASYAAMRDMPHQAGVASAVLTSSQMGVGGASAALVAALFDRLGGSAMPVVMLGFVLLAWVFHLSMPTSPPAAPARPHEPARA